MFIAFDNFLLSLSLLSFFHVVEREINEEDLNEPFLLPENVYSNSTYKVCNSYGLGQVVVVVKVNFLCFMPLRVQLN
jgi:hypothetical protein